MFEQLVSNLGPGQRPVLRLAGDSTDWDWYPVPGWKRPPWVRYTLTDNWLAVAKALASDLDARLILGVSGGGERRQLPDDGRSTGHGLLRDTDRHAVERYGDSALLRLLTFVRAAPGGRDF